MRKNEALTQQIKAGPPASLDAKTLTYAEERYKYLVLCDAKLKNKSDKSGRRHGVDRTTWDLWGLSFEEREEKQVLADVLTARGVILQDTQNALPWVMAAWVISGISPEIAAQLSTNKQLLEAGFRFEDHRIIAPEGFHTPEKIQQIEKTLNYLGWLESKETAELKATSPDEYKLKKVEMLHNIDDIDERVAGISKKLLEYRYMNSVYQDMNDDGLVIQKIDQSTYKVIDPITWAESTAPYVLKILESKHVNSFNFDFAVLSSITRRKATFNESGFISQKHTIATILDAHGIKDKSGEQITPINIIRLDWNGHIKGEVAKKIAVAKSKSLESYQELLYLESFIENEEYLKQDQNRAMYKELNAYDKAEWAAATMASQFDGTENEKTLASKLSGIMKEIDLPLGMIGVVLMIFSGTRSFWKLLLWGALAAYVGSKVIDATDDRFGWPSDEDLGIIIPTQVIHAVDNSLEKNYGSSIGALQKLNLANRKTSGYNEAGKKLSTVADNENLTNIASDIAKYNINDDVNSITWAALFATLQTANAGVTYTEADVTGFLGLLTSQGFASNVDNGDETLLDYLSEGGKDILNRPYEAIAFTDKDVINAQLNEKIKAKWDLNSADPSLQRKDREDVLKIQVAMQANLSSIKQGIENVKATMSNMWNGVTGDTARVGVGSLNMSTQIDNAINVADQIDPVLSGELKTIFEWYKKYLKLEAELAGYEGFIDENIDVARSKWYAMIGIVSEPEEARWNAEIAVHIESKLANLKQLLNGIPAAQRYKEPYVDIIKRTKKVQLKLEERLSEVGGALMAESEVLSLDVATETLRDRPEIAIRNLVAAEKVVSGVLASRIDVNTIHDVLHDTSPDFTKAYSMLVTYQDAYTSLGTLSSPTHDQSVRSYLDKFNTSQQQQVQDKVETVLSGYYSANETQLTNLSTIDSANPFQDNLKALQSTESFLQSKNIMLTNSQKRLIEALNTNTQEMMSQLNSNTANQWSGYEEFKDAMLKLWGWLQTASSTTVWWMLTIDEKLHSYYTSIENTIGGINLDGLAEGLAETSHNLLARARNELGLRGPDQSIDESANKADEIFGTSFTRGETMQAVVDEYGDKKEVIDSQLAGELASMAFDPANSEQTKADIAMIDEYKRILGDRADLRNKADEIATEYIQNVLVANDPDLVTILAGASNRLRSMTTSSTAMSGLLPIVRDMIKPNVHNQMTLAILSQKIGALTINGNNVTEQQIGNLFPKLSEYFASNLQNK